ncbi:radical SAM protein [Dysosmobacter sp.]|uniref:radical SAM protein n=1 Tax=Dysosmobacter sp. TaxID=2591382 RepID=UPI002A8BB489|nr:radical SAM protein [Dysosmobacter sp.]MDY3282429.1 radical SAM protein [Dysosmobacter sp.]
MHYTGTIWRPPYEADSLLLEVTAGCTHHNCKFCTLYRDLPFRFRMFPLEDIESDLLEAQLLCTDPIARMTARLRQLPQPEPVRRVFLTGANPFVLQTEKLLAIAERIHRYLPSVESIGCFARVTDSVNKTDEDLAQLRQAGYNGLTIGAETGDNDALSFMNKGYTARDILTQCRRLEAAGIEYGFFYLTGISGKGKGDAGAKATAEIFNQLHPFLVGPNMLTIYPDSGLYQEIRRGAWQEEGELEKYRELRTLVENLRISTYFAAMGASNEFQFHGKLPEDRDRLLAALDRILSGEQEDDLRDYRRNLPHL